MVIPLQTSRMIVVPNAATPIHPASTALRISPSQTLDMGSLMNAFLPVMMVSAMMSGIGRMVGSGKAKAKTASSASTKPAKTKAVP